MQSQRGGTLVNVLLVLMLIVIGALLFMLIGGEFKKTGRNVAITSPALSYESTSKQNVPWTFSDGLGTPDTVTHGMLDEFGAGIESVAEFNRDINNDGKMDRITRTHVATGNAHDYEEYKIELNNNGVMNNITPKGMRTTKGADCALRLIQFTFKPHFGIKVISRPFQSTWDTPSVATQTTYTLSQNKIVQDGTTQLSSVCDVTELFK